MLSARSAALTVCNLKQPQYDRNDGHGCNQGTKGVLRRRFESLDASNSKATECSADDAPPENIGYREVKLSHVDGLRSAIDVNATMRCNTTEQATERAGDEHRAALRRVGDDRDQANDYENAECTHRELEVSVLVLHTQISVRTTEGFYDTALNEANDV